MFLFIVLLSWASFAQDNRDWPNLQRYAKENQVLGKPAKGEKRVVFMGNSITEGWKTFDSSFFANRPYIDRGISGQTTPQMLIRFRPDVIDIGASVVVILAGINDIAENTGPIPVETIYGNIVSMAELARMNQIRVVLCSVLPALDFPWRPGLNPTPRIIQLNQLIRDYAKKNQIPYVDYYSNMVDEHQGLRKDLSYDPVHPSLPGYKVMAPLVEEGIRQALRQK